MKPANYLSVGAVGNRMAPPRSALSAPAITYDSVGAPKAIRFEIWPPASKKNHARAKRDWDTGKAYVGSDRMVRHERRAIRIIVEQALAAIRWRMAEPLFGEDDDVEMELEHLVERDVMQVTVRRIGPPQKVDGRTGRRRDVVNLFDSISDALQGLVYGDDRQISRCSGRRAFGGAS